MKPLSVLVACETSGAVRDAFIKLGHSAISCDILPHDSGSTVNHHQGDVLDFIQKNKGQFDLMIAHPPCTYLCNSGVSWLFDRPDLGCTLSRQRYGRPIVGWQTRLANSDRVKKMQDAAWFFLQLLSAPILCKAIENPIQHCYARQMIRKYDQIVQPWMFGHPESKATCLWLERLPKLAPTNNVRAQWKALPKNKAQRLHYLPPSPLRWKLRSKTFQGLADAMASQWGIQY